jgi:hypothetical protein
LEILDRKLPANQFTVKKLVEINPFCSSVEQQNSGISGLYGSRVCRGFEIFLLLLVYLLVSTDLMVLPRY